MTKIRPLTPLLPLNQTHVPTRTAVQDTVMQLSSQPSRGPLVLNFVPLNPKNGEFSTTSTQENNKESLSPTDRQLHPYGNATEFPFTENSLEGPITYEFVYKLHLELSEFGYKYKEGDIVCGTPLSNQARDSSKIPNVTAYKN